MKRKDKKEPATPRDTVKPALGIVGFAGRNDHQVISSSRDRQVLVLANRFALSIPMALVVASLAYGGDAQ